MLSERMKILCHDGPDTFILTITFLFKELQKQQQIPNHPGEIQT